VVMHTKDTHEVTFTLRMHHKEHVFAAQLIIISTLALLQVKLTHVMTLSVKLVLCVVYALDTSASYLTSSGHCDLDIKYHTQQYRKIGRKLLGKKILLSAAE